MEVIIDGGTVVTVGSKGIIRDGVIFVENSCIVDARAYAHRVLEMAEKTMEKLLARLGERNQ